MELRINTQTDYASAPLEIAETAEAGHHHVHEVQVAAGGLGLIARVHRMAQSAQIKLIESTPALAPFLETQAGCACKAGCVNCAGPTIFAPLWAASKDWLNRRFSRAENETKELPSLSERPADFVMRSAEANGFPHPAPKPIDPAETLIGRFDEDDTEKQ